MPDIEYLTTNELAEELAVTRTIVVAMVRNGSLPALRSPTGRLRFERAMFERWISDQYAETRRWILNNPNPGMTHGDWREWPIGRDDGRRPTTG